MLRVNDPSRVDPSACSVCVGETPFSCWRALSVLVTDNLQGTVPQQWRPAEITIPGVSEHGSLLARVVLHSGADISPISALSSFVKLNLRGGSIRTTLVEGPRFVRLSNGPSVSFKQKSVSTLGA